MPPQPKSRDYRPVTRAFLVAEAAEQKRLAAEREIKGDENAEPESEGDEDAEPENKAIENTEFLCGIKNWADHCDAVLEKCENALLSELGDNAGLSDDDSDSDLDVAMEEEVDENEAIDRAFDNGYFCRSSGDTDTDPRSYKYQMQVEKYQGELEEKRLEKEVEADDSLYQKLLKQLRDVDEGRDPRPLESMDKPKKKRTYCSDSDADSDDDASSTKTESDAEEGPFPQLQPRALQRVINFFRSNPHVKRKACEDFCKGGYRRDNMASPYKTSRYKTSPSELGSDGKWPSGLQRPPGVLAYPSEFQFDEGYMVQVEAEIVEGSGVAERTGMMTMFYFTFEELDKDGQLESAREVYGDLVPDYTYVCHMGLPPGHRQLFVWRIDCPAGQPFSTDASYFGLRRTRQMYASVLRDLVDLVAAPLAPGSEGDKSQSRQRQRRNINVQHLQAWPTALHNPRIDADNVIVRSDYSGIVGLLLWTTPSVITLPFGASLLGLLGLEGMPLQVQEAVDKNSSWTFRNKPFHDIPVRKTVDTFPFETYSRNAYDLERLMLHYLQAKVPALARNPTEERWKHVFAAMRQAVEVAADMTDGDKECYRHQIDRMEWDWFHFPDEEQDAQGAEAGEGEKMEIDG